MKNLLTITQLKKVDIEKILEIAIDLEKKNRPTLQNKNILFAFEKPSLRTKIAAEVAINQLGGNVIHIEPGAFFEKKESFSKKQNYSLVSRESLKDTVQNVSQWCDGIFARVFSHKTLLKMTKFSKVPIVNALCDQHHPMQVLADLLTIQKIYDNQKISLAFVGDANNVAFSLLEILLKFGHDCRFAGPAKYSFSTRQKVYFESIACKNNTQILFTDDPFVAVKNAHFVYTDTYVSMGEENIFEEKIENFRKYQINGELFSNANKNAFFMHCLPAHRNIEVTDNIIDSKKSIIYQQAKNRMVISKGVFTYLLNPNYEKE